MFFVILFYMMRNNRDLPTNENNRDDYCSFCHAFDFVYNNKRRFEIDLKNNTKFI